MRLLVESHAFRTLSFFTLGIAALAEVVWQSAAILQNALGTFSWLYNRSRAAKILLCIFAQREVKENGPTQESKGAGKKQSKKEKRQDVQATKGQS